MMPIRMIYRDRARSRRRCIVAGARSEEPTAEVHPVDAPSRSDLEPTERVVVGFQMVSRTADQETAWMERS